ncbi:MAG: LysR family transcriptional regulator [Azoarcus sp.]|jgi:DNA-binding transcriptional LysR family regulator|nr:LysR family transcriptional regulator [Azoarcus sp.]MDX9839762.1 LysR family transcriptional regulator [Azoarcus sp.]
MQLDLSDAALFVRVVELGTLSAAARERNESVSQVSRAIARMESALSLRLLRRSTHGLSLTDEGDIFLAHARRMLDIASEMESELSGKLAGPSGLVRINVSPILAQMAIVPSLPGLYERHPGLQVEIMTDDRVSDLVRDGVDIAMRAGVDNAESLVVRQIGELGRNLYAAPAYLEKFGVPCVPADLTAHRLIANSASQSLNRWPFRKSSLLPSDWPGTGAAWQASKTDKRAARHSEFDTLLVKGHTRADSTSIVLSLALQGIGIAHLNELLVSPLVRAGQLTQVLAEYTEQERIPFYAVMLQERHRLPKVRACMDYWQEWFAAMRSQEDGERSWMGTGVHR